MVTPEMPEQQLSSGAEMPMLGIGTYDLHGDDLRSTIRTGYDIGYRHIDMSEGYDNESVIGGCIQDLPGDELFLTSKVIPPNLTYDNLISSCEESLDRLDTDYLDLYLVHWPNPAVSMRETFDAMGTLVDRRLVRNVGVSNFSAYQLRYARHVSPVQIAVNQIEFHPWWSDEPQSSTARKPILPSRRLHRSVRVQSWPTTSSRIWRMNTTEHPRR
jgi:diketogulonate reductase-like aldo/keto reductase